MSFDGQSRKWNAVLDQTDEELLKQLNKAYIINTSIILLQRYMQRLWTFIIHTQEQVQPFYLKAVKNKTFT